MDLSYLPNTQGNGHHQPWDETIKMWQDVKTLTDFKTELEIGFNVGHSASMVLTLFDDVKIFSIDIFDKPNKMKAAEIVRNKFPGRFGYDKFDSKVFRKEIAPNLKGVYDMVFVDGYHKEDWPKSDVEMARELGAKHVLVDDMQYPHVADSIEPCMKWLKCLRTYHTKYNHNVIKVCLFKIESV